MDIFAGIAFHINKLTLLHPFFVISIGQFISGCVNGFIYFIIMNQAAELYLTYTRKAIIFMLPVVVILSNISYAIILPYYFLDNLLNGYDSMTIGLITLYFIPYFFKENLISLICNNNNQSKALKYFVKFNRQSKTDQNVKQHFEKFKNYIIKKILCSFGVVFCARLIHTIQSNVASLFGGFLLTILQQIKNRKWILIVIMSVSVLTVVSGIFSIHILTGLVCISFVCVTIMFEINNLEKSILKFDFSKGSWPLAIIGILCLLNQQNIHMLFL